MLGLSFLSGSSFSSSSSGSCVIKEAKECSTFVAQPAAIFSPAEVKAYKGEYNLDKTTCVSSGGIQMSPEKVAAKMIERRIRVSNCLTILEMI